MKIMWTEVLNGEFKSHKPVEELFDPKIANVISSIFLSNESIFWISPFSAPSSPVKRIWIVIIVDNQLCLKLDLIIFTA